MPLAAGRPVRARRLLGWERLRTTARAVAAVVVFTALWAGLSFFLGLRTPAHQSVPAAYHLLPALDLVVVLAGFALVGARGRRVGPGWLLGLTCALLAVRIVRLADSLIRHAYYRPLNVSVDVPLLPELARLLGGTVAPLRLVLSALLIVLALALAGLLVRAGLATAARLLATSRACRLSVPLVALLAAALSALRPPPPGPAFAGFFGQSALPEIAEQVCLAVGERARRRAKLDEIRRMQAWLATAPADLAALGGADVLLFLVESYGQVALTDPRFRSVMTAALTGMRERLAAGGTHAASRLVRSPVYGGGSWLAHATLHTGVEVSDGLDFAVLRQELDRRTMATYFRDAGYGTVLVQPGTTRRFPEAEVIGFQRKHFAPDLGYRGPRFGWALMPDQYLLEVIHRRELTPGPRPPRFIEYALVASHAPWNEHPPLVADWAAIGDGSLYHRLPPRRFPVRWENLAQGSAGYLHALLHDLQLLERYLSERLTRPTLILILGDHQPPAALTQGAPSYDVPLHVLTADRPLLDRFLAHHFTAGLLPTASPSLPMRDLLPTLLKILSHPPQASRAVDPLGG